MKYRHEKGPVRRVSEPVQVYLDTAQRARLDSLAAQLALSKSDILRLALEALERQVEDPDQHPALRILGIAGDGHGNIPEDAAAKHDEHLAADEVTSWKAPRKGKRAR